MTVVASPTNMVMGYMLNAVRTGNPIVDGILSSVIMAVISYSIMNRSQLISIIRDLIGMSSTSLASLTVYQDERTCQKGTSTSYATYINNVDFDALIWKITNDADTGKQRMKGKDARSMTFFEKDHGSGKNKDKDGSKQQSNFIVRHAILPARNSPISVFVSPNSEYEITVMYAFDIVGSEEVVRRERLVLRYYSRCTRQRQKQKQNDNEPLESLRTYLGGVRNDYVSQLQRQEWKQCLFRVHRLGPSNSARGEEKNTASCKVVWKGTPTHSTKTLDTVVLDDTMKLELQKDLQDFLNSEEWYASMGLPYKRGYMFYGPPGTGKTSMVMGIANVARYDIYSLDLSKLNDDSEMDEAFDSMPERCVVMLEDVDCMHACVKRREKETDTNPQHVAADTNNVVLHPSSILPPHNPYIHQKSLTLSHLLNNIDGVGNNHGRIYIMTTNHPNTLDPALVRCGRIDHAVYLGACSDEQVIKFFQLYYPETHFGRERVLECAKQVISTEKKHQDLFPSRVSSVMQQYKNSPEQARDCLGLFMRNGCE